MMTDEECFFYLHLAHFYEVVEESTGDPLGEHKKGFGGICKE